MNNHLVRMFHWKFWKPIKIGPTRVWFGVYYMYEHVNGGWFPDTAENIRNKLRIWPDLYDDKHYNKAQNANIFDAGACV